MATTSFTLAAMRISAVLLSLTLAVPASAQTNKTADIIGRYAQVLRSFNSRFTDQTSRSLAEHVLFISDYYNIDPAFVMALVNQESGWHATALSDAGAIGLGQLMPGTARGLNVIPTNVLENLDGTVRYIRRQLDSFQSVRPQSRRFEFALAAYNAGPAAVEQYGGIPPYRETINYVASIMASWSRLQRILPTNEVALGSTISISGRRLYVDLGRAQKPSAHRTIASRTVQSTATSMPTNTPAPPASPSPVAHLRHEENVEKATLRAPFDIVAFTGESTKAACGPENLLDSSALCGWDASQSEDARIGLVLDLGDARTVREVMIRFTAGEAPDGFEVATSNDPRANADEWLGIRYCRVPLGASQVACTIGERRPRAIRIIIDGAHASIREVRLLAR